ncbi:MAG: aerobic carbon-monoxide dehydrogenase small subunit [Chloroflexota bacterium]|jgi:carbon-monoxide dehydrogenase small subunit|nr:aerobic carbon-monoxide dehydrogenase small subunit [Chloroflexota bacterium]
MTELLQLTVNGRSQALAAESDQTLLDVLRNHFKLFSVREACGLGVCGSCTVSLDGRQVSSCLVLALQAAGREVETVEALSDDGSLHPIQQAFVEHGAFQCSFCTPGFLLATRELLTDDPDPTPDAVRHYLAGNLCRCGSYLKIEAAVLDAAARLRPQTTEQA